MTAASQVFEFKTSMESVIKTETKHPDLFRELNKIADNMKFTRTTKTTIFDVLNFLKDA